MTTEDGERVPAAEVLSSRAKLTIFLLLLALAIVFLWEARSILSPFLWAIVAAYVLGPIVNYLNLRGGLRRLWAVTLIYLSVGVLVIAASTYLYPRIQEQVTVFLEDIPKLEASLVDLVGPRPLGIDIASLVSQLLDAGSGYTTNSNNASHLLVNALETVLKLFLFLVTTFYLLMDGPRLRSAIRGWLPPAYEQELSALGRQIDLTWQQYIRGELLLFAIMSTVTSIGLTVLGVPGGIFLGLVSGILELLPLVGPITAGALAVSVAYFSGSNPWGWSQVAYGGSVAIMYFVLRQAEDYVVTPHVLGRAVRLHPVVVLFALTTGGVIAGLLGLLVAVPIAASLKAILTYLYSKLLDRPVVFEPVRTISGGVIEIPMGGTLARSTENPATEGPGAT